MIPPGLGLGDRMKRFIEGVDRGQTTLFPNRLEDWVDDDNPVQAIDVVVDELDLFELGFDRVAPCWTGRPGLPPRVLGYWNVGPGIIANTATPPRTQIAGLIISRNPTTSHL